MVLVVKNVPAIVGDIRDAGLIPGSRRSPGGGRSNPLQYSCLESLIDRRAWGLQFIELQRVAHDRSDLAGMDAGYLRCGWKHKVLQMKFSLCWLYNQWIQFWITAYGYWLRILWIDAVFYLFQENLSEVMKSRILPCLLKQLYGNLWKNFGHRCQSLILISGCCQFRAVNPLESRRVLSVARELKVLQS